MLIVLLSLGQLYSSMGLPVHCDSDGRWTDILCRHSHPLVSCDVHWPLDHHLISRVSRHAAAAGTVSSTSLSDLYSSLYNGGVHSEHWAVCKNLQKRCLWLPLGEVNWFVASVPELHYIYRLCGAMSASLYSLLQYSRQVCIVEVCADEILRLNQKENCSDQGAAGLHTSVHKTRILVQATAWVAWLIRINSINQELLLSANGCLHHLLESHEGASPLVEAERGRCPLKSCRAGWCGAAECVLRRARCCFVVAISWMWHRCPVWHNSGKLPEPIRLSLPRNAGTESSSIQRITIQEMRTSGPIATG